MPKQYMKPNDVLVCCFQKNEIDAEIRLQIYVYLNKKKIFG